MPELWIEQDGGCMSNFYLFFGILWIIIGCGWFMLGVINLLLSYDEFHGYDFTCKLSISMQGLGAGMMLLGFAELVGVYQGLV